MISTQLSVRAASKLDHAQIANLIYFEQHVHRHLDWRGALDWLGAPEYWVVEQFGAVTAALACPPDPEGVAWLRLFTHAASLPLSPAWDALWNTAKTALQGRDLAVAAITTTEWLQSQLVTSGFSSNQQIVVLEHDSGAFRSRPMPTGLAIRPMNENDLPVVKRVDWEGFAPLWRNSLPAIRSGFLQAGFATVATLDGEIIGYQISTRNSFGAHLARLAVSPRFQGHGIGYLLVQDLLIQTRRAGLYRLTVNTQNDNSTSLSLYQKIGFEFTGERYTVYTYQF